MNDNGPHKECSPWFHKWRFLFPAIAVIIGTAIAAFWTDHTVIDYFQSLQSSLRVHATILTFTAKWGIGLILIFAASRIYGIGEWRTTVAADVLVSAISAFLTGQLLHLVFPYSRPFTALGQLPLLEHELGSTFPSDHATIAFAVSISLLLRSRSAGIACLVATIIASLSRIALLLHWPSDVVCGAILGTLAAVTVPLIRSRLQKWLGPSTWRALFERDDIFCAVLAVLRLFVAFGILLRFLGQNRNIFNPHGTLSSPIGQYQHYIILSMWIVYAIYVLVTGVLYFYPAFLTLLSKRESLNETRCKSRSASNVALRRILITDTVLYTAYYVLTGNPESNLFVCLALPLVATALFLNISTTIKALAFAILSLVVGIVAIWTVGECLGTVHFKPDAKQRLTLNVLAPRAFLFCLCCVPIAWLIERHSQLEQAKVRLEDTNGHLENAKARYESLVEHIPQMITRKDLNGIITFANKAFCRLNKLPIEQIIGVTDKFLYGDEMAERFRAADQRVIETKTTLPIDETHRPYKQTREIDVEGFKVPVCDATGKVIEVQVIFSDVTDKRQREMQLESLMETAPDNIYFKDLQSRFTWINRALTTRFKLKDPSEAKGKSDFEFFSVEHAQQAFADEVEIMQTGKSKTKEEKETWPDGSISWASTTKQCLKNKRGEIIGTFGISRDITEKKKAEARLAASEAKYRLIIEHAAELIYIRTLDGTITSANHAVEHILGYTPEEVCGNNILKYTAPRYVETVSARLNRKNKTRVTREEIDFVAKDNSIVNLEFTARVIRDRDKKMPLVVSIGHDITWRKRAEEQAMNNARRFKYAMEIAAHECRAPLQIIISLLTTVKEKVQADPQGVCDVIRKVEEQALRIKRQVDNALTLDKFISYNFSRLNIGAIVAAIVQEFSARAEARELTIVVSDSVITLPVIVADNQRIAQVITNLVDNAVKYSERSSVITIRGKENESTVEVSVENYGRDISQASRDSIFEFGNTKGIEKTNCIIAGTGLGLPIVNTIVKGHGGKVVCTSVPRACEPNGRKPWCDHIVTFSVTLPKSPNKRTIGIHT